MCSAPQPFWHQGPVLLKTIFPHTQWRVGQVRFWDDSSALCSSSPPAVWPSSYEAWTSTGPQSLWIPSLGDIIKKVKRQPKELEKLFINHISDKDLLFRIYNELLQFTRKRQPSFLNVEGLEQTFLQRRDTNGQQACWEIITKTRY